MPFPVASQPVCLRTHYSSAAHLTPPSIPEAQSISGFIQNHHWKMPAVLIEN
jgi:hypothetical protein